MCIRDSTDTGEPPGDFDPAAVGFKWHGIWDESADELRPYYFFDFGTGATPYNSYVTISLATTAFFSMSSDDPLREDEYCNMYATFDYSPAELSAEYFDYEGGVGGTGESVELYAAYEGRLDIYSVDERCDEWIDRDPLETFDGTHIGFGLGPMTADFEDMLETAYADEWPDYEDSYLAQYVAVNHPADTAEGYDFIAYDWNTAFFASVYDGYCTTLTESDGTVVDACGLVDLEERSGTYYYEPVDASEDAGSRVVFAQGSIYWYEDFPNLDLDMMTEGAP